MTAAPHQGWKCLTRKRDLFGKEASCGLYLSRRRRDDLQPCRYIRKRIVRKTRAHHLFMSLMLSGWACPDVMHTLKQLYSPWQCFGSSRLSLMEKCQLWILIVVIPKTNIVIALYQSKRKNSHSYQFEQSTVLLPVSVLKNRKRK